MRALNVWLLLGLMASSCRPLSLKGDPFAPLSKGGGLRFWTIDWWAPLVSAPLFEYLPREPARPAMDAQLGLVWTATRDGFVRAVSSSDGALRWEFKSNGPFNAGPMVHEGTVFVGGADGALYALDAQSGSLRWRYDAHEELLTTPVWADGKVLVVGVADSLYAIEAASGAWGWQYRRDAPSGFTIRGAATPTVVDDRAYVGFSDGTFVCLNVADGTVNWEKSLANASFKFRDVDASAVNDTQGRIFTASYATGVTALEAETGNILWSNGKVGITSIAWHRGILVATGEDLIAGVSPENGRLLWSQSLKGRVGGPAVSTRGFLAVPTGEGLVLLDSRTGDRMTQWNPGKGVSASPLAQGTHLYVLSNLGTLFDLNIGRLSE